MIGTVLDDRYHLDAEIGRGAMGVVYRARDTTLGRDVAVKLISPTLLDPSARARFLREARAAGRLNHPNVVTLHDAAEAGSTPYLVMELVEGRGLREAAPFTLERTLEIARQLCAALAHAHGRGIVHRDLKPENVVVAGNPAAPLVKLMDFGLASAEDVARLTHEGTLVGTFAYMAPEQVLGEPTDGRTDLYALGILLYEMTTGRVPFRGASPQVVLSQHLKATPVPPRTLVPDLPESLEAIILRLLEKAPDARFPTAEAVLAALDGAPAEAAFERPGDAAPIRAAGMPHAPSEIIGRARELEAARVLVLRPDVRLVTLTGTGGTGKTRLALRLVDVLRAAFEEAWFVPLGALLDPELVAPTIARAIDPREPGAAAVDAIVAALGARRVLLVLDNFEQLLTAAGIVADIVARCPAVRVVVTSRERLRLDAEHVFAVPPLELPAPDASARAAAIASSPAIELFMRRARMAKPGFELTDANAAAVTRICAHVDGLPLSIELAAARAGVLTPEAIADQLERPETGAALDLLAGGPGDRPGRQRTQRGTIQWSVDLLAPEERALFVRLAAFHGSFALEAARAVAAASEAPDTNVLGLLASLSDQHLVRPADDAADEARFVLPETVRQFAVEQLERSGEAHAIAARHFAYRLAHVTACEPEFKGARQNAVLDALERDLPNLRAVLGWALARGDAEGVLRLVTASRWFWLMRGHRSEGRRWIREAIASGADVPPALHAHALHVAGNLAQSQGDLDEAIALFEDAAARCRTLDDRRGLAHNLGNLGIIAMDRGDHARAVALLEQGMALWRELGERPSIADALLNLSSAAIEQGDDATASAYASEGLAMFRQLGNRHHASACTTNLGVVALYAGDLERAEDLLEEGLAIRRSLDDPDCSGNSLLLIGRLSLRRGDVGAAEPQFREGLALLRRAGARGAIAGALEGLAATAAERSEWPRAAMLLGGAEALRETVGSSPSPRERDRHAALVVRVREALGERAARAAWVRGRALPAERWGEPGDTSE